MARYAGPYLRLDFTFSEDIDPQPLITSWHCNLPRVPPDYTRQFQQDIQYVKDGHYYVEHCSITHGELEEAEDGIIWPYAEVYYTFEDYETLGVWPPIVEFCGKCRVDSSGNLDVGTFEFMGDQVPDEDTAFTSIKLNQKPRASSLPNAIWAYDADQEDWFWFTGDDALALTQTGGGRYNNKVIFVGYDVDGNGVVYFG